jgi:hypothetical protein
MSWWLMMCQIDNPISVMERSERRKMAIFDLADIFFIFIFLSKASFDEFNEEDIKNVSGNFHRS